MSDHPALLSIKAASGVYGDMVTRVHPESTGKLWSAGGCHAVARAQHAATLDWCRAQIEAVPLPSGGGHDADREIDGAVEMRKRIIAALDPTSTARPRRRRAKIEAPAHPGSTEAAIRADERARACALLRALLDDARKAAARTPTEDVSTVCENDAWENGIRAALQAVDLGCITRDSPNSPPRRTGESLLLARDAAVRADERRRAVCDRRGWCIAKLQEVPADELGALNYGEGTCTTWDEIVAEHNDTEDEEERAVSQYQMIVDGSERVRARLIRALGDNTVSAYEASIRADERAACIAILRSAEPSTRAEEALGKIDPAECPPHVAGPIADWLSATADELADLAAKIAARGAGGGE